MFQSEIDKQFRASTERSLARREQRPERLLSGLGVRGALIAIALALLVVIVLDLLRVIL